MKKLTAAIEQSPVSIVITDPEGVSNTPIPLRGDQRLPGERGAGREAQPSSRPDAPTCATASCGGESPQGRAGGCSRTGADGKLYWEAVQIWWWTPTAKLPISWHQGDISERHAAEMALSEGKAAHHHLRRLQRRHLLIGLDGRISHANFRMAAMFGYAPRNWWVPNTSPSSIPTNGTSAAAACSSSWPATSTASISNTTTGAATAPSSGATSPAAG